MSKVVKNVIVSDFKLREFEFEMPSRLRVTLKFTTIETGTMALAK